MGCFEYQEGAETPLQGIQGANYVTYHGLDDEAQRQRYLRNRVSYTEAWSGHKYLSDKKKIVTTTYSYDPHGNVEWMRNYIPGLGDNYMRMDYDLVSGKVLKVYYNEFVKEEAFFHKYVYDNQLRLKEVYTSRDNVIWDKDASYDYYAHGPLKRTELGEDLIQGLDYTYTIQGWIKAVNHPHLENFGTATTILEQMAWAQANLCLMYGVLHLATLMETIPDLIV